MDLNEETKLVIKHAIPELARAGEFNRLGEAVLEFIETRTTLLHHPTSGLVRVKLIAYFAQTIRRKLEKDLSE